MTILGKQSVAELRDWMASRDAAAQQLAQAYADFSPTWVNADAKAFEDWTSDWQALQGRYATAHDQAQKAIDSAKLSPLPDTDIPAQTEWDALLHALKASAPPDGGPVQKGDFDDLVERLQAAQSAAGQAPANIAPPQPTPGLDTDLSALQGIQNNPVLNAAANAGQAIAGAAAGAAGKAASFLSSPWFKVAIAGSVAGLVLLVVVAVKSSKHVLPLVAPELAPFLNRRRLPEAA